MLGQLSFLDQQLCIRFLKVHANDGFGRGKAVVLAMDARREALTVGLALFSDSPNG